MIASLVSILIGILAVFPFLISLFLMMFTRWTGRSFSMRKNADYTTPFLFLSVYIIAHTLFGDGVGYVLCIVSIVIMIVFTVYEKRRVKDFEIGILLRKAWRLYFIILAVVYILLVVIGLVWTVSRAIN